MKTPALTHSTPEVIRSRESHAARRPAALRARLGRWSPLLLCALAWPVPGALAVVNQFELTPPLVDGRRFGHTATLLADGKVWVVGGRLGVEMTQAQSESTELYNPATGLWTAWMKISPGRYGHTASLLASGKVFIQGGLAAGGFANTVAVLVDHSTAIGSEVYTGAGNMDFKANSTATYLSRSWGWPELVIVGGEFDSYSLASISYTAMVFSEQTFFAGPTATPASSYAWIPRAFHTLHAAAVLPGGRALIVGGREVRTLVPVANAEIMAPSDSWSVTGSLITARHSHTATALKDGKVLVIGGVGAAGALASTELYNPATGVWTATSPLAVARSKHTATLLWDGRVLVTGGINPFGAALRTTALYDPATDVWSASGPLVNARSHHTATLLQNRKVLIVGGDAVEPNTAELYDAPYRDIAVEQPVGTVIANGGGVTFFAAAPGSPLSKTFTIRNTGTLSLGSLGITKSGPNPEAFTVTTSPATSVGAGAATTFTIQFAPTTTGTKTAAIQIANNTANNPVVINLTGVGLSSSVDTDGDGISDGQEAGMTSLGFDWQVRQPELVASYYATAGGAGLYTTAQMQALNADAQLLTRDAATGKYKLTLGFRKSTDLVSFSDFPMNGAGSTTTINGAGKLEFLFTVPDNAAFFRVKVE